MRKNFFARDCILGMLAILFVSACEGNTVTISNPRHTLTPTFSPTASFTVISSPIMTDTEHTVTPIIGAMREHCIEMTSSDLGQIASIKGLVGYDPKDGTAFSWNENASRTYFPVRSGGSIVKTSVSPDYKYVLYFDMINQGGEWILKIIDSSLKILYSKMYLPSKDFFGWFDSQRLWNYREGSTNSSTQLNLINPFNGSQQELTLDYPSIVIGHRPSRWTDPIVKYDPGLSLAVYPACDADCPYTQSGKGTSPTVLLFNTVTKKIISGLTALDDFGSTPIWLSDGSRFIMSADIYSRILRDRNSSR